ncbi:MAG TPA: lysophospholipid acyltransferase family protein [Candidatus Limnocylindrales bacterium]|nr:lysophospholipid acyltransferase family protein [Candidatus Limnocylindrales bacterium]
MSGEAATTPKAGSAPASTRGRDIWRRLALAGAGALGSLAARLPERLLDGLAGAAGAGLFLVLRERRELARANLRRVCAWLVAHGRASPAQSEAANGGPALDRLARRAFGHWLRSYLEMLMAPTLGPAEMAARIRIDDPAAADAAFAEISAGRGAVLVGLHFGAVELPAIYAVQRAGVPATAPMETLGDPALQRFLETRRAATGVRIVPLAGAARVLREVIATGGIAGFIGDRDIAGGSRPVELFGAPARLPAGPALLAVESGAPFYVGAAWRIGPFRYAGRLERVEIPAEGSVRARVAAALEAQARAFERLVAEAPEQWWSLLQPMWHAPREVSA